MAFHAAWNGEMHRFLFSPLSDEATAKVERRSVLMFAAIALALLGWPGAAWRG